MKTIEVNEMAKYIDAAPNELNLMFIGDTGIGKTSEIEKYCADRNIFCKTLILSQLDASEALGIPVKVEKEFNGETIQVLDTAVPIWVLELAEHENAMLFLDEFLCAQPSVMNSFLNFLTQRKVKNIDLSHVKVVSATNIGHYTYDPDNNMLSRFCMFYVENKTASTFVNDPRIEYKYEDINQKEGVIFDYRSLKPRCYYQLSLVKEDKLYYDFYEGFTNSAYIHISDDEKINTIFKQYVEKIPNKDEFKISESNMDCLIAILKENNPSIKNWKPIVQRLVNLNGDTMNTLMERLCPATAERASAKVVEMKKAV